ncbi:MAG: DUF222 domain-containing protein [Propionicimonas sp.]|nr:DUF222 domain-containing protein [Propionicimonas sp.]
MEVLARLDAIALSTLVVAVARLSTESPAAELVDRLRELENLKNAAAAAQTRLTVALRQLREGEARAAGAPVKKAVAGVVAEVALARRESPHRAARLVGLARVLDQELPATMAAFVAGRITEWRASLIARETACISRADRLRVDAELAGQLDALSDREVAARARCAAYALDAQSVVERAARAEADRRVTIRPAPDSMALVSALLPVSLGVAVYAALKRTADGLRAAGDPRGLGQAMADTLVSRVTGGDAATVAGVEVQLVMSDQALLAGSETPARFVGYGPIPAGVARRLVAAASRENRAWVRRLYASPGTGQLVAMESRRRRFPAGMRNFLALRDEVCRTPWCGAPMRHADHIVPRAAGGPTTLANGQGLCERCNQAKESRGWMARPGPAGTVITTTPTGHEYRSPELAVPHEPPRWEITVDLRHLSAA